MDFPSAPLPLIILTVEPQALVTAPVSGNAARLPYLSLRAAQRRGNPYLKWRGYFMRRGEVTPPYAMYRETLRRAA